MSKYSQLKITLEKLASQERPDLLKTTLNLAWELYSAQKLTKYGEESVDQLMEGFTEEFQEILENALKNRTQAPFYELIEPITLSDQQPNEAESSISSALKGFIENLSRMDEARQLMKQATYGFLEKVSVHAESRQAIQEGLKVFFTTLSQAENSNKVFRQAFGTLFGRIAQMEQTKDEFLTVLEEFFKKVSSAERYKDFVLGVLESFSQGFFGKEIENDMSMRIVNAFIQELMESDSRKKLLNDMFELLTKNLGRQSPV